MRLTNYHRDAFVASVLADTAAVNVKPLEDEFKKVAIEATLALAPPEVRKLWANNATRGWVATVYFSCHGVHAYVPGNHCPRLPADADERLAQIGAKIVVRRTLREDLTTKLRGVLATCGTRKALVAALPEFEKYLPEEERKVSNLPVLTNVMSDFVKAG
jgi:hypothetical protein